MVNISTNINISTEHTMDTCTSHLDSLNTQKTMTYDIGNPGPGLEQKQKCGWAKPVNGITTLLF
jgi:hypothetical protein